MQSPELNQVSPSSRIQLYRGASPELIQKFVSQEVATIMQLFSSKLNDADRTAYAYINDLHNYSRKILHKTSFSLIHSALVKQAYAVFKILLRGIAQTKTDLIYRYRRDFLCELINWASAHNLEEKTQSICVGVMVDMIRETDTNTSSHDKPIREYINSLVRKGSFRHGFYLLNVLHNTISAPEISDHYLSEFIYESITSAREKYSELEMQTDCVEILGLALERINGYISDVDCYIKNYIQELATQKYDSIKLAEMLLPLLKKYRKYLTENSGGNVTTVLLHTLVSRLYRNILEKMLERKAQDCGDNTETFTLWFNERYVLIPKKNGTTTKEGKYSHAIAMSQPQPDDFSDDLSVKNIIEMQNSAINLLHMMIAEISRVPTEEIIQYQSRKKLCVAPKKTKTLNEKPQADEAQKAAPKRQQTISSSKDKNAIVTTKLVKQEKGKETIKTAQPVRLKRTPQTQKKAKSPATFTHKKNDAKKNSSNKIQSGSYSSWGFCTLWEKITCCCRDPKGKANRIMGSSPDL